jgi:sodium/hydrogen antiporter
MGPEWATQTRRVVRAEDVVVNRDRVIDEVDTMELGESDKMESDTTATDKDKAPETPRDENPPAGGAMTGEDSEWREGPHLIIEHSRGPGNEVRLCQD